MSASGAPFKGEDNKGEIRERNMDDLEPRKRSDALDALIREDLSMKSVEELTDRIELLKGEIERISAEIGKKQNSRDAAEAFFRK